MAWSKCHQDIWRHTKYACFRWESEKKFTVYLKRMFHMYNLVNQLCVLQRLLVGVVDVGLSKAVNRAVTRPHTDWLICHTIWRMCYVIMTVPTASDEWQKPNYSNDPNDIVIRNIASYLIVVLFYNKKPSFMVPTGNWWIKTKDFSRTFPAPNLRL